MGKVSFLSIFSILLLLSEIVSAQDLIKIKGKVTDIKGDPLIGANVIVHNTSYGSSSERNGSYFIDLPASEIEQEVTLGVHNTGHCSSHLAYFL